MDRSPIPAQNETLFHRGWASASMWEHYADHHKGACLVFDREALGSEYLAFCDSIGTLKAGDVQAIDDVEYKDSPLNVPISGTFGSLAKFHAVLADCIDRDSIKDLFLRKSIAWKHEREARIVYTRFNVPELELDNPTYVPISSSLKAIVLGEAFGDTTEILKLAGEDSPAPLEIYRCVWNLGAPNLRK
nr:hypothetical protein Ade03nite_89560 [Actinoplanes derwentensis]